MFNEDSAFKDVGEPQEIESRYQELLKEVGGTLPFVGIKGQRKTIVTGTQRKQIRSEDHFDLTGGVRKIV